MDKSTTQQPEKPRAQEELRRVLLITRLLEDAGIHIVGTSTHGDAIPPTIVISCSFGEFREWVKNKRLEVNFTSTGFSLMPG